MNQAHGAPCKLQPRGQSLRDGDDLQYQEHTKPGFYPDENKLYLLLKWTLYFLWVVKLTGPQQWSGDADLMTYMELLDQCLKGD